MQNASLYWSFSSWLKHEGVGVGFFLHDTAMVLPNTMKTNVAASEIVLSFFIESRFKIKISGDGIDPIPAYVFLQLFYQCLTDA